MGMFKLNPEFTPRGDQAQAIAKLAEGLRKGYDFQTLLGATGTGKTFTMAAVIAEVQRPALVIAHNKTLAAQLCQEFRAFFPENAVQYFISYYDYYQPEAYIPQTDTYIEKTASINDEIDRLRHAATQAVLERRDVIVVASVSCIYGLGSPQEYLRSIITVKRGDIIDPRELAMRLVELQYVRSDMVLGRGTFRIRGDVIDVQPADEELITRIELFGDEVERIYEYDPLKGEIVAELERATFFPATHYVTPWNRLDHIIEQIREELEQQVRYFEVQGRLLEAQRIRQRTEMDIEMMRELGYCNGIENYSRYFDGAQTR
jgi:excinuclease ABC subunit B